MPIQTEPPEKPETWKEWCTGIFVGMLFVWLMHEALSWYFDGKPTIIGSVLSGIAWFFCWVCEGVGSLITDPKSWLIIGGCLLFGKLCEISRKLDRN